MPGLRALFRKIAETIEEEAARQRGEDPRARPGYGTHDDREQPEPDPVWEPERESARVSPWARERKTVQGPWSRERPGSPAPPSATQRRAPETRGAQAADHPPWDTTGSRTALPYALASPTQALLERLRGRLDTPDALREAFVVLDRPLARRRVR
ncbi:MAG: hypothetical protein J4G15_16520 [Alphaproteobacteria bacterium]|nr:hypothetical protein [Alphaproteobacteria bacterium]